MSRDPSLQRGPNPLDLLDELDVVVHPLHSVLLLVLPLLLLHFELGFV